MEIAIDYPKRIQRIRSLMKEKGIDILVATRGKSLTYIGGAFIPWRSTAIISADGYAGINTLLMDAQRIKEDSWLDDITGCAPLPGIELWEVTVAKIRELGGQNAVIGVELGHSPRVIAGYLFATELEYLKEALPEATFVNALDIIDTATYVKEPQEIRLMRQAAAIADAAQARCMESLCIGMTEQEIAGIGEMEMRRLGSEFHWPVTGSNEIASGYRTAYPLGGCTPPADKIIQPYENILIDLHPTYRLYYADLSHNYIIGKPSADQERLADVYLAAAETLIAGLKTGNTIGKVWKSVMDVVEKAGYAQFTLPAFGHGLGVIGHEWYPAIVDNDEFRDLVLETDVVEVAALVINVPGTGGMRLECPVRVTPHGGEPLCKTPLSLTVIDY